MKLAFVFRGLFLSFQEQFGYNAIPIFPNINLHSCLPHICQPNVTQLTLTDSDPAEQQRINVPRSKYRDKTGLNLGMIASAKPQL
jgi:hypothetical protein